MSIAMTVQTLFDKFQGVMGRTLLENTKLFGQYHQAKGLGDAACMGVVQERAKVLWEPFRYLVGSCIHCNGTQIIRFEEPQDFYCPACVGQCRPLDGPGPG